jgi:arylsulfatase A-like enzyme
LFLRNHQAVDADMILTTDYYPARQENTVFAWDKKHSNEQAVYWEKGVWWRQGEMSRSFRVEDCLSEIVTEGVAFIDKQASENPEKPFFLYLPLTGPHTPWMPSERFKGKSGAGVYGDFIFDIDDAVAQIKNALNRNGIAENTILIFSSDNGAYWPQEEIELHGHDSNIGRKGQKGDVWDGGHRIPLVISWPAKIKQPLTYKHLVSLTDFFTTFCDLTGQKPGAGMGEDSFSFFDVLNGNTEKVVRESMIHHSSGGFYAIRMGDWKYIDGLGSGGFSHPYKLIPEKNGPKGQLYNIREDALESQNLYFQYPEKVKELSLIMKEIVEKGSANNRK